MSTGSRWASRRKEEVDLSQLLSELDEVNIHIFWIDWDVRILKFFCWYVLFSWHNFPKFFMWHFVYSCIIIMKVSYVNRYTWWWRPEFTQFVQICSKILLSVNTFSEFLSLLYMRLPWLILSVHYVLLQCFTNNRFFSICEWHSRKLTDNNFHN